MQLSSSSSSTIPSHNNSNNTSGSIRPRNRRSQGCDDAESERTTTSAAVAPSVSDMFEASQRTDPSNRIGAQGSQHAAGRNGTIGQFLEESISNSWVSVQGFATSFLSTGEPRGRTSRYSSPAPNNRIVSNDNSRKISGSIQSSSSSAWGPQPPSKSLGLDDVAAGSLAQRDAALRAAKTASVLESHEGVNGGLDVTGKHKRRNSNEIQNLVAEDEDHLVYVHHVQAVDSFVGIVLRYKCREDIFRKANGLWSRDSVQTRKWLVIPVDACEIRGRPCDAPSWNNAHSVDLLARTPSGGEEYNKRAAAAAAADDFFSSKPTESSQPVVIDDSKPWTHVRWVKIDSIREPVEIGRISRQALGYFPPRRKQSISSVSTPRQSLDLISSISGLSETPARRESALGTRPQLSGTPVSARSRGNSDAADPRPAWMRRPGGVGSMSRSLRAPGPGQDNFNTWAAKHFPSLNADDLPSMSIMGSETLRFGFSTESGAIVESPYEQGTDTTLPNRQGTGLDRAAAAVETWLRGALAKRPATPLLGARRNGGSLGAHSDSDLIELADTGSDDGRLNLDQPTGLLDSLPVGSTSRSDGTGFVKARAIGTASKGKKDD